MSKEDLLNVIKKTQNELESKEEELRTLTEKYEMLIDFQNRCSKKIEAFDESVGRRKIRMNSFDTILDCVKSATQYKNKMLLLLTGAEYTSAINNIESLINSITTRKRQVSQDVIDTEDLIEDLKFRLKMLQIEYDNYPKEAGINE